MLFVGKPSPGASRNLQFVHLEVALTYVEYAENFLNCFETL